jgi:hypothetical protein
MAISQVRVTGILAVQTAINPCLPSSSSGPTALKSKIITENDHVRPTMDDPRPSKRSRTNNRVIHDGTLCFASPFRLGRPFAYTILQCHSMRTTTHTMRSKNHAVSYKMYRIPAQILTCTCNQRSVGRYTSASRRQIPRASSWGVYFVEVRRLPKVQGMRRNVLRRSRGLPLQGLAGVCVSVPT